MQKEAREISVNEAAEILQVTERTVLNLIKSKNLRAEKVGKRWYVDTASVRAQTVVPQHAQEVRDTIEQPPKKYKPQKASADRYEGEAKVSEKRFRDSEVNSIQIPLNCLRIAGDIFSSEAWLSCVGGPQADATPLKKAAQARVVNLQFKILESLGAGYHCYGAAKASHYGQARAAAGGLLALLCFDPELSVLLKNECLALREKLIPALVALQRTAEKRIKIARGER